MSRWINGLNCCLIKKKTYLRVFRTTSKDTSKDVSTGYLNTDTWMNALVFSFFSFGSLSLRFTFPQLRRNFNLESVIKN